MKSEFTNCPKFFYLINSKISENVINDVRDTVYLKLESFSK